MALNPSPVSLSGAPWYADRRRYTVRVTFRDGNTITTEIYGSIDEIRAYYAIGKRFKIGVTGEPEADNLQPVKWLEFLTPGVLFFNPGQRVRTSGFDGVISRHYDGSMYEVRLGSGCVCVTAEDIETRD